MNISFSSIAAGIVFSGIGLWFFREGKRRDNTRLVIIGIALMVYTYFTSSPWLDWGVGLALCGAAKYYWYY
ncbi:MAG: hypothetical protein H7326_12015 [Bdellovibrionaceae bacterium]|nr:hypothetical protein [Pseudobdellovibrionaceae bacterium]